MFYKTSGPEFWYQLVKLDLSSTVNPFFSWNSNLKTAIFQPVVNLQYHPRLPRCDPFRYTAFMQCYTAFIMMNIMQCNRMGHAWVT